MSSPGFELAVPFTARGKAGAVSVTIARNTDPGSLGCDAVAEGFPVCRSTVSYAGHGYDALLGWVQLVGTETPEEPTRRFGIDPLRIYEGLDNPFCFYGLEPTLFDAPSRRDRSQALDWLAHSFLCVSPTQPMARDVAALVGVSWGFVVRDREVHIVGPRLLPGGTWSQHLALLSSSFPSWRFYESDP